MTVVGTFPTHRRRGVLRAMMRAQLDDVHARGEPLALLWASEDTIYGRYGYGMASQCADVSIPKEFSSFARPLEREGTMRIVDADEALKLFPRVWDAVRRRTPGMLSRTRNWWELRVLFEPPEAAAGARAGRSASSSSSATDDPRATRSTGTSRSSRTAISTRRLQVVEAVALDGRPTAEIWRYLLDIDWAARITASLLPVDHALWWLLATPRRMRPRIGDGLWVRLVDVGAALSARSVRRRRSRRPRRDRRVLPVERRPLACLPTARRSARRPPAQLRLDVSTLGSTYLGAFSFSELVRGGRVEELRRGAAARADAMFAAERAPWCPEIF